MNQYQCNLTLIAAASVLVFSSGAMAAPAMSKDEFKTAKNSIAAEYKAARAACNAKSANAKDVCVAEARGKERVARAELEARNQPGDKTRYNVGVAKAQADYAVAREKCDDKAGNDKSVCVKDAKAAEARAKAEAKAQMKSADAKPAASGKSAAASPGRESPGAYVEDSVITAKVKAEVLMESSLKSAEINVETYKGVVQLSGFVRSRADIDKAVAVARGVKGVASVKNDMVVKGQQ